MEQVTEMKVPFCYGLMDTRMNVREILASAGVEVLYLPPYSPDLNPIEMSFSKLKALLRKERLRDVGALQDFLVQSPSYFSQAECEHYFNHAGYTLHD
jgi:transposase